jgi:uroporphyrinogen decarboxylase
MMMMMMVNKLSLLSVLAAAAFQLDTVGAWSSPRSTRLTMASTTNGDTTTPATPTTPATAALHHEYGVMKTHEHCQKDSHPGDRDILVRAARGERTERTPVWLMRQAGRYMSSFREYSDVIPFRQRSETPDYAVELSLQCHRAYGMDGIIMFSDILTPLPVLGIDFDVVKGVGPVITTNIRTEQDVQNLPLHSFEETVPFVRELLQRLSKEAVEANTSLIGFVGAPFTLASYTIEGKSDKHCLTTNKMMMEDERGENMAMSMFLEKLANMIGDYACFQIESGAEMIQMFESWAHQLSPAQFERYAKPAAVRAIEIIKERHPNVPVVYFANGGSAYLELQRDMPADMIAVDWSVDMATARSVLGEDVPISGNLDPTILFGSQQQIEQAVRECIDKAGGPGNKHLLNLGHGVMQGTPEIAVKWLVDECKRYQGKSE